MSRELFSERLERFRKTKALTQQQMGDLLGVTSRYIGDLEKGKREVEESSSLFKLFGLYEANLVPSSPSTGSVGPRETLREESATGYTATPREPVPADARDTTDLLTEARDALQNGITSGRASYFKLALEILDELRGRRFTSK